MVEYVARKGCCSKPAECIQDSATTAFIATIIVAAKDKITEFRFLNMWTELWGP